MSAKGRLCCKSRFAQGVKNSAGRRRGFRVKMRGTSSPYVKPRGDLGKATAATRIGGCFSPPVFAKNWSSCNFRLLQQNLPTRDIARHWSGPPPGRPDGIGSGTARRPVLPLPEPAPVRCPSAFGDRVFCQKYPNPSQRPLRRCLRRHPFGVIALQLLAGA